MAELVIHPISLHTLLDQSLPTKMSWLAAIRNVEGCSLQQIGLLSALICLVTLLGSRENTARWDPWAVQSWYHM